MANNKQEAVESVRPFIRYFHNLSPLRKAGLSFFIKSCSKTPETIKSILAARGGIYKTLLSGSIHIPTAFTQALVLVSCILFILSVANSASYLYYFFVSVLLGFSAMFALIIRASSLSKAGLALQFRIPENFQKISWLIEQNHYGMSISKSSAVRYAGVAFDDINNGDLDAFKLVAVINGALEHFNIDDIDIKGISDKEDIIDQLLNDKMKSGVTHGQ